MPPQTGRADRPHNRGAPAHWQPWDLRVIIRAMRQACSIEQQQAGNQEAQIDLRPKL